MSRTAWPSRFGLALSLVLFTLGAPGCARGPADLEEQGASVMGGDGGVAGDGATPSGDGDAGPAANMDSGLPPPMNGKDAGTPPGGMDAGTNPNTQDPRPVLTDIDPASVAVNPASDLTLTVLGSAFVARSVVQADGAALATTFLSSTELRAIVPQSSLGSIKTLRISVFTSAPGGGQSLATRDLRVVMTVPVLTTIAPTYANVGSATTEIVATGSGFQAGAVLVFDNADVVASSVTATELKASVPAAQFASGRSVLVRVKNPGAGGGISAARTFEVRNLRCVISAVSPLNAQINTAFTLQLTGMHLVSGSTVRINGGAARTPSAATGGNLTVSVPAADVSSPGTATITVTVPSPTTPGEAECTANLAVDYAQPAISSLSPNPITVGANDTVLNVTGTGFYVGSSQIRLDGVAAPGATTCTSATQCRTTLPRTYLANGKTVQVTVSNPAPGGGVSNAVALEITNPSPVLTTVSPSFVAQGAPAQTLTLTGSGFVAGSQVVLTAKVGGAVTTLTPASQSATQLTVGLPAAFFASAAAYDVTVVNPAPSGGPSAARPFTVWSGSCPSTGVDLPIASTGVTSEFDLSWAAAATSTAIYGGSSSCGATLNANIKRKYRTVVVQNNSPAAVVLSAWAKCAASDAAWLAFYKGTSIPMSDTALSMCNGKIGQGVGLYGAPAADSAGSVSCPGLMRSDNASIRLEACESTVVYMQMQSTTGGVPAKLRVRAETP